MIDLEVELFAENGEIKLTASVDVRYNQIVGMREWQQIDSRMRRRIADDMARNVSQYFAAHYKESLAKHLEDIRRDLLGNIDRMGRDTPESHAFAHGMEVVLGRVRSAVTLLESAQAFRVKKVRTLRRRADEGLPWNQTRAPYSYEFEDAVLPAPPVLPDPLWCGLPYTAQECEEDRAKHRGEGE